MGYKINFRIKIQVLHFFIEQKIADLYKQLSRLLRAKYFDNLLFDKLKLVFSLIRLTILLLCKVCKYLQYCKLLQIKKRFPMTCGSNHLLGFLFQDFALHETRAQYGAAVNVVLMLSKILSPL